MLFLQMFATLFLTYFGCECLINWWITTRYYQELLDIPIIIAVFGLLLLGLASLTGAWYLAPFMGIVAW